MEVILFRVVISVDVGCAIFIKIFETAFSFKILQLQSRFSIDGLLFVTSVLFFKAL